MKLSKQERVSQENKRFWAEKCGTQLASSLGLKSTEEFELNKFDQVYFDIYPYLKGYVEPHIGSDKTVAEIGLGYGSLSEFLISQSRKYVGFDISNEAVDCVNIRSARYNADASAHICDITNKTSIEPYKSNFDTVVAIGCLHHTGNLELAINNCASLLKPGGVLIFMVYNSFSYRMWRRYKLPTLTHFVKEMFGIKGRMESNEMIRSGFDKNLDGQAAPHTDFVSKRYLKDLLDKNFSEIKVVSENIDEDFWSWHSRERLLKTKIPKFLGLDNYVTARKR